MRTGFVGTRALSVPGQFVILLVSSMVIFVIGLAREVRSFKYVFVEATEVRDADADQSYCLLDAGPNDQRDRVLYKTCQRVPSKTTIKFPHTCVVFREPIGDLVCSDNPCGTGTGRGVSSQQSKTTKTRTYKTPRPMMHDRKIFSFFFI